jgi:hypothetical protein
MAFLTGSRHAGQQVTRSLYVNHCLDIATDSYYCTETLDPRRQRVRSPAPHLLPTVPTWAHTQSASWPSYSQARPHPARPGPTQQGQAPLSQARPAHSSVRPGPTGRRQPAPMLPGGTMHPAAYMSLAPGRSSYCSGCHWPANSPLALSAGAIPTLIVEALALQHIYTTHWWVPPAQ